MLRASLIGLLVLARGALALLVMRLRKLSADHRALEQQHTDLENRFRPVVDIEVERRRVLGEFEAERAQFTEEMARARAGQQQALQQLQAQHQRGAGELQTLQTNINQLRAEFAA